IDILRLWRPTPLVRATRLEQALGTPARIYFKDESVSPAGSHKPNTAVAQTYYNKAEGIGRIATETGAGQWGSALSFACQLVGLALPFVPDCAGAQAARGGSGSGPRLVAVEPSSCPTLTEGRFEYDFGDEAGMTPKILMYTLGHEFIPPPIHAGGLRYHGDA